MANRIGVPSSRIVNSKLTMTHIGEVSSGRGVASSSLLTRAPVLQSYFGAEPVPGTLNVLLLGPVELPVEAAIIRDGPGGMFWAAELEGVPCLAVRAYVQYFWPLHAVEFISTVHLRSTLQVVDGDKVKLTFPESPPLPWTRTLAWAALWAGRRQWFYSTDAYWSFIYRNFRSLARAASQPTSQSTLRAE